MQAILITLASAIILAIVAAFAAPFVVDWNAWRATFETEAGRVIGAPVLIRGGIEAELLPVPRLVLRQVSVGADAISTGGTIDEIRADLALGALLRGEVEAQGLTLVRPRLRLVLDSAGRVALPTGAGSPAGLSITRLGVENGSLQILDRGADRELNLTGLDLKGEARSLSGPFRLEGEMEAGGRRQGVRLSLGKMGGAEPARLRLIVDDRARALALDLDGAFRLDQGTPRYDGRVSLIRRPAGAQDEGWRVVAGIKASPEAVVAETLDLTLGDEARAAQLSGSARLALGRALGLDAVLNAKALDVDPLLRGATSGRTPAELAGDLAAAFTALDPPVLPVRIGVGIDQLTLGGTVVREARIDLAGDESAWRLDMAEARLPGQALIRLTGAPAAVRTGSSFLGEALFTAEDPATFLRWAAPRAPAEVVQAVKGPVRLSGRIAITESALSVGNLAASFGTAKASGSASYVAGSPARLDIVLALDGFNLDPLLGAARVAVSSGLPVTGEIALSGRDLTLSGLPLGTLAVNASAEGEGWKLSRLSLDDLAGLRLEGQGTFARLAQPVIGRVDMTVSGARAQGLEPVARIVAGGAAADIVHRLLPVAAPVNLTAFAQWREDGSHILRTEGQLGQLRGSLAVRHGGTTEPLRADLSVAAEDGARVLEAAGLGGLRSGQGAGQLDLSVRGSERADSTLEGRLTLGDAVLEGKGTLRAADQGFQPTLALRLTGGDLSRIFAAAATAEAGPLPASLAFTLRPETGRWQLEDLTGTVAGAPVSGSIGVEPGAVPRLTGRLDLEEASLTRLIGLWGARSEGTDAGPGAWSAARFTLASGPAVTADMRLQARRLGLADNYRLTDAGLRLIAGGSSLELRDLSGGFGGGRLAGSLLLHRRPDTLAAEGHLALTDVDGAALLAPLAPKAAPRGRVNLILDLLGSGRSPLLLVQSLVGQGTLAVKNLEIAAADPSAIAAVLAATATGAPPDERRTTQMLDRALARGPLRLAAVESTLGVVNGVVRVSPARTQMGQERATLSASFDLARLTLEASLELEAAIVAGAAPGGTITWRGPVAAPERQVTATALTAVIAMRAIERETRRLEDRQRGDGGVPAPSAGMPTDAPAAPPPAASGAAPARTPAQPAPSPAAPAAPRVVPREAESRAPPLPPPLDIGPSVRPRAVRPMPQGGVSGPDFMPYAPPGWGDVYRPPGLVPGQ